jgi:hypothetical protein
MAKLWQVVEKEAFGVDWAPARFGDLAVMRFATKEEAEKAARRYVTELNVENALTAASKLDGAEAFLVDDTGIFLGVLDGKDWYLTYPKDEPNKEQKGEILHKKGEIIKDKNFFQLDGKMEVAVRVLPGT